MKKEKLTVFIADDNKDFRDCLANYIEKQEDMTVIGTASDGKEAYKQILSEKPDVALIDGIMPNLDGLGVLERLKENNCPSETTCIMLTAVTDEKITQRAFSLGAKYYVAKPFDTEMLINRIRQLKAPVMPVIGNVNGVCFTPRTSYDLESRVTAILHEIGVPAHIRGYNYMREAIIMAINDIDVLNYITKQSGNMSR